NRLDVNFNEMDDLPSGTKASCLDGFSNLEAELRNFAVKKEVCLLLQNGFTVGDEPLSLKKIVSVYHRNKVASLIVSVFVGFGASEITDLTPALCDIAHPNFGSLSSLPPLLSLFGVFVHFCVCVCVYVCVCFLDEGETLLHRACKRNQVETVLQILALPGTDVNVKDHAGWTPLHEACNHGSTECVRALLHHHPAPVLTDQVAGVSPLHDALLNGHLDIAKMLLEHAGSVLLQQTDGDGQTPLDLVSAPSKREELLRSAQAGDSARTNKDKTEVLNLPLLEAGSSLLGHLIFSYQKERGLPGLTQSGNRPHTLVYKLVAALEKHSLQKVTSDWTDQRAVRLAEDVETLLRLSRGEHKEQVSAAAKECRGENTVFLMETLENLQVHGKALVADL
uniref:SMC5-SMC6 complex localization factor 1 n=1 Tax=Poecilia reticulata TaxID=8081 RepID=A0A3P9NDB5_POERE